MSLNWEKFRDLKRRFSVVVFVQDGDMERYKGDLETLGKQRNVRVVVQPCPFEGIEFLGRYEGDLLGHMTSLEKDLFWHAFAFRSEVPEDTFKKAAEVHYAYLCAILEQNIGAVQESAKSLQSFSPYFSS